MSKTHSMSALIIVKHGYTRDVNREAYMTLELDDTIINNAIKQHSIKARKERPLKIDDKSKMPKLSEINGGSANIRNVINAAFWDKLVECSQETNQYAAAGTYGQCAYCMKPLAEMKTDGFWYLSSNSDAQMDHLYPASMGWPAIPGAIILACKDCNSKKSDQDPEEFLKIIHNSPEKLAGLPDAIKTVEAHWRFLEKNYKEKAIAWARANGDASLNAMIEWATGVRKLSDREAYIILDGGSLEGKYDPSTRTYGYSIPIQGRLDAKAIATMFWEPSEKNNSMNLKEFIESIPADYNWEADRTANERLVVRLGRDATAKDDALTYSSHNINYKKLRKTLEDYYDKLSKYYGINQDLLPELPIRRRSFDLMDKHGAFDLPGWSGELLSWVDLHNNTTANNKFWAGKSKKPVLDDAIALEVTAAKAVALGENVSTAVSTLILDTLLSIPSDNTSARSSAQSRASRMSDYADSRWGSIIDVEHLKMTSEALSSKWPGISYLWSIAKQDIDDGKKSSTVYAWNTIEKQITETGMTATMDEIMHTGDVESIKKVIATIFKVNYCDPSDGKLKRDNLDNAASTARMFKKTIIELLESVMTGSLPVNETMRFYKTCSQLNDNRANVTPVIGLPAVKIGYLESWFSTIWKEAMEHGLEFSQIEKKMAASITNSNGSTGKKTIDDLGIVYSDTWRTVINEYEAARTRIESKTKPNKFSTLLNHLYRFHEYAVNNEISQDPSTVIDPASAWNEVRRVLALDEIRLPDVESLLDSGLSLVRLAVSDNHTRTEIARSLNSVIDAINATGVMAGDTGQYLHYECGHESNSIIGSVGNALEEQYDVNDASDLPDPSYVDVLKIPAGSRKLDDVLCNPSVSSEEKLAVKWCDCVFISGEAPWVTNAVPKSRASMPSFSTFIGPWFDLPGLLEKGKITNTEFREAFKRVYQQKVEQEGKIPSKFKDDWNIMMAMFKTLALKAINVSIDDDTLPLFPSYDELMIRLNEKRINSMVASIN